VACCAGARNRKETLLQPDLPAPAAGAARGGSLPRGHARTVTGFAGFMPADRDLLADPEYGFFELDGEILPQIGATLGGAAPAGSAAKQVFQSHSAAEAAEDLLKQVKRIHRNICRPAGSAHPGVPIAIIGGALIGVAQDRIRFTNLFKPLLGFDPFGISLMRVLVGVVLNRQTAVRSLDLLLRAGSGDA
jgi:hypothetical protein